MCKTAVNWNFSDLSHRARENTSNVCALKENSGNHCNTASERHKSLKKEVANVRHVSHVGDMLTG